MDTAVALVQSYLHLNGYFTVTEYPVLAAHRDGHVRTVTDLDILAYRFAGAGHDLVHGTDRRPLDQAFRVDPALGCPADRPDMIVGEVKEGAARLNHALRDPAVLSVALARFGCCPPEEAPSLAQQLIRHGIAATSAGHVIRVVAFGATLDADGHHGSRHTVAMAHVVEFLQGYLHEHWPVVRHAQLHDPALAVLGLLEKWGVHDEHRTIERRA